jgi:hypothetical protein
MRLMSLCGLDEAVRKFTGPVLGTCAGMIVLDRRHLGAVDIESTGTPTAARSRASRPISRSPATDSRCASDLHPRAARPRRRAGRRGAG